MASSQCWQQHGNPPKSWACCTFISAITTHTWCAQEPRQLQPRGAIPASLLLCPAGVLILLGPGAGSVPLQAVVMLRAANESLFSAEVEVELCSLHQSSPDNAATGGLSARGENQSWGVTWSKQLGKEMQGGGGRVGALQALQFSSFSSHGHWAAKSSGRRGHRGSRYGQTSPGRVCHMWG